MRELEAGNGTTWPSNPDGKFLRSLDFADALFLTYSYTPPGVGSPIFPRRREIKQCGQADWRTVFVSSWIAKHDRAQQKEESSASQDSPNYKISRHDCRLRDLTTMALLKTAAVFRNISRARSRVAQHARSSERGAELERCNAGRGRASQECTLSLCREMEVVPCSEPDATMVA